MAPAAIGSRRERRQRIASAAAGSDPLVSARGCLHAQRLKRARDGKPVKVSTRTGTPPPGERIPCRAGSSVPTHGRRRQPHPGRLQGAAQRALHARKLLGRGTAHRSSSLTRTSTRRRAGLPGTFKRTISAGTATINFLDHRPRRSVPKNRFTITLGPLTAREGRKRASRNPPRGHLHNPSRASKSVEGTTHNGRLGPLNTPQSDLCQLLLSVIGFCFLFISIFRNSNTAFWQSQGKNFAFALVYIPHPRYIDVSKQKCLNCPIFVQIGQICLCRADQFALEPPTESQKNRKTTQNSSE